MAARIATMATTQTTSSRVNPPSRSPRSVRPAGDIGCRTRSTLLPVGPIGDDVVGAMLSRRPVHIGLPPGIVGPPRALQIGAVPRLRCARTLHQGGKTLGARGIASG